MSFEVKLIGGCIFVLVAIAVIAALYPNWHYLVRSHLTAKIRRLTVERANQDLIDRALQLKKINKSRKKKRKDKEAGI